MVSVSQLGYRVDAESDRNPGCVEIHYLIRVSGIPETCVKTIEDGVAE
jgi:hypothetical protein